MLFAALALTGAASTGTSIPVTCATGDAARRELLAAHERAREAHLGGAAALMARGTAETLLSASNGRISSQPRDEVVKFFATYFGRVKYLEWSDVAPPIVEVSDDGGSAWMAVAIRARLEERGKPEAGVTSFRSSWVATYRRGSDCAWQMTSIASDVVPET